MRNTMHTVFHISILQGLRCHFSLVSILCLRISNLFNIHAILFILSSDRCFAIKRSKQTHFSVYDLEERKVGQMNAPNIIKARLFFFFIRIIDEIIASYAILNKILIEHIKILFVYVCTKVYK